MMSKTQKILVTLPICVTIGVGGREFGFFGIKEFSTLPPPPNLSVLSRKRNACQFGLFLIDSITHFKVYFSLLMSSILVYVIQYKEF